MKSINQERQLAFLRKVNFETESAAKYEKLKIRRGLGDLVETFIAKVLPSSWLPKKGSGCGCAKRKALLNNFKVG
jgi:hypothetical protein